MILKNLQQLLVSWLLRKKKSKQIGYEKSLLYKNLAFSFTLRLLKSTIPIFFHQVSLLFYVLLELIVIVGYVT